MSSPIASPRPSGRPRATAHDIDGDGGQDGVRSPRRRVRHRALLRVGARSYALVLRRDLLQTLDGDRHGVADHPCDGPPSAKPAGAQVVFSGAQYWYVLSPVVTYRQALLGLPKSAKACAIAVFMAQPLVW